jgi:hypothetical protein
MEVKSHNLLMGVNKPFILIGLKAAVSLYITVSGVY